MNAFRSTLLIVPGLGNSGEGHWQTMWQNDFGLERIEQREWDTPVRQDWVTEIENNLSGRDARQCILVGHSLACATIGYWARQTKLKIKGALLVAPSDTEAPTYPPGTSGFSPMPMDRLPFPTVTIASSNDFYVTESRAKHFANAWGSRYINIGNAGHINVVSGFGAWPDGLKYLLELDKL